MVKGIDGISYLPLLTGNGEVSRSHEYIYYEFYEQGGKQSILKDGWKLVRLNMSKPEKLKEELYYLPDDIGEQHDLLKENPSKSGRIANISNEGTNRKPAFQLETGEVM